MQQRPKLVLVFCAAAFAAAAPGSIWKTTPAPPASWQRDRVADLSARRKAVMARIGTTGILVMLAAEPRVYAGDVDWPYRQENDFYYLTGISEAGSMLVLIPGAERIREILFVPAPDPAHEDWTGHLLTASEASAVSGIGEVWDARLFDGFLEKLIPEARGALPTPPGPPGAERSLPSPPVDADKEFSSVIAAAANRQADLYLVTHGSNAAEYRREQELESKLKDAGARVSLHDATSIFAALRAIKSQREIEMVEHAIAITAEGFQRAFATAAPGRGEYEIQAQFDLTFSRRNAHWGYPPIVGAGVNATTLHYEANRARISEGDLLLIDAGAEFDGYSADVTRTIPMNGRFTAAQAEIYRLVWSAQQAAIAAARPGASYTARDSAVRSAAVKVLNAGLLKLGLITNPNGTEYTVWLNHGISHSIGLNVHDPDTRELEPGMIVTIEPGLYFRPDALDRLPKTPDTEKFIAQVKPAFEKYKGIGVRIEDDVLITSAGARVLSAAIPSRLRDVEDATTELRQASRATPLP
jgi:Xaa-Pro aminopeptidase